MRVSTGCGASSPLRCLIGICFLVLPAIWHQVFGISHQASADEAVIRALVERFFTAYAREDLDSLMALWSEKSPEYASHKEAMQKVFAENEKIEVKRFIIRKITGEGVPLNPLKVRVVVEISAVDAKTGKPASGFGKMNRTLYLVKEGTKWKVWNYVLTEQELADALVAARTDEECKALLAEEKELVSAELVWALIEQGNRLHMQENYKQAFRAYILAHNVANQIGFEKGVAHALGSIGHTYQWQGDYKQALEFYQKAMTKFEILNDNHGLAITLNNIGYIYEQQGNYEQALEFYQRSLTLSQSLYDKEVILRTLINIARIYHKQDNYTQALEFYQKALSEAIALNDKRIIAPILGIIGNIYNLQSKYEEAIKCYLMALAEFEVLNDKMGIIKTLNSIGNTYCNQGNYAKALEFYQKGLTLAESINNKRAIAAILNNIGATYESQGNYLQALNFFQKSLTISRELGDYEGIGRILVNIGSVYFLQGNHLLALMFYQKAKNELEAMNDKDGLARVFNNIALVYESQGNYSKALEFLYQSLALHEKIGNQAAIAATFHSIGLVYQSKGDYKHALEFYHKTLSLAEVLDCKDLIAKTLHNIGNIYLEQNSYKEAIDFFEKALAISEAIGNFDIMFYCYYNIGRTYKAQGWKEQAISSYQKAITIAEILRYQVAGSEFEKQRFFEEKVKPYYEIIELFIEQNRFIEAFTYAERSKARVLLDILQLGKINITKTMTEKEKEQEQKLKSKLISLNTQIIRERLRSKSDKKLLTDLEAKLKKVQLEYEAFQNALYVSHPELKVYRGETSIFNLNEVDQLLPDEQTMLLEFVVTEEKTFLFTITKEQNEPRLRVYTLDIKEETLRKEVNNFRERISKQSLDIMSSALRLYELLLKPIERHLSGKRTLIIVPDGILWDLPFQTLQSQAGRFLIEDYAVTYTPSLTALREMTKKRRGGKGNLKLLAMGNPKLREETIGLVKLAQRDVRLDPLPMAEKELNQLKQLYGKEQSKIYVGAQAKEKLAKEEAMRYHVLHFATHGLLNNLNPMYSHILLVAGEGEDGLFEAWEIMNLDLQAEVVVLSACETARGRLGTGEGIIGLTWALFVAGSPTNVVSQWKVADESTAKLMVEFHRNLLAGKTKAEALREAQLSLLKKEKKYRHPFFWAPFILVGDWQ